MCGCRLRSCRRFNPGWLACGVVVGAGRPFRFFWPGVIGAALFTPIAVLIDWAFRLADQQSGVGVLTRSAVAEEYSNVAPPILLVWLVLNASRLLRLPLAPSRPEEGGAVAPEPAFWDRVPRKLGRDLVALSAELHDLRVCTDQGDALVLYPFGRAIR